MDFYASARQYAYRVGRQTALTDDTEELRSLNAAWDEFIAQFIDDVSITSYLFTCYIRGCNGTPRYDVHMHFQLNTEI